MNNMNLVLKWKKVLMGFATLWIYYFHCWNNMLGYTPLEFFELYTRRIGFCGVDIFLFLSGMTLVYSIEKNGVLKFYLNRFKRVVIPFFMVSVMIGIYKKWSILTFVQRTSGYSFFHTGMYVYLWFYFMILIFYIAFPIYYWLLKKSRHLLIFTTGMLLGWFIISMLMKNSLREDFWGMTNRIPIFIIGIYMGCLSKNHEGQKKKTAIEMVCIPILVVGLYLAYLCNYKDAYILIPSSNCCVPNILISVSLCIIGANICEKLSNFSKLKFVRVFIEFYGMISLELYFVQETIYANLNEPMVQMGLRGLYRNAILIVTITSAGYFLYLISQWCQKKIFRVES